MTTKKIVKVSIVDDAIQLLRQTPGNSGVWGNYVFCVNDDSCTEADFWVVVSKGRRRDEACKVARENVILLSGEPDSVYLYADSYLKQFGVVIAASEKIRHPHLIKCQPALMWFLGVHFLEQGKRWLDPEKNYDYYQTHTQEKSKVLSLISSDLSISKGHQQRLKFIKQLQARLGTKIDIFGRGFHALEDKWDALAPYKYTIALENSVFPHYWTEKLADAYLTNTFPIYSGCPNAEEYFPADAMAQIDICNPEAAIATIENCIASNAYEQHLSALLEAKRRVLDEHNICALLPRVCDTLNAHAAKEHVFLKNEMSMFNINKVKIAAQRLYWKLKSKI